MPELQQDQIPPISPHLAVSDASAAIAFYKKAFGAIELSRHMAPDGKRIMHAALAINGGRIMLNDEFPEYMGGKRTAPDALGGTSVVLHLQVPEADPVFNQAVAAGATVRFPLKDQFWGDRYGQVTDPFGHIWSIGSAKKQMQPGEVEQAAKAHFR